MEYDLSHYAQHHAFTMYWHRTIVGRILLAVYRPVDEIVGLSAQWFTDALVLRTAAGDIALMTDSAGGRVRIDAFPQIPAARVAVWTQPASRWQVWTYARLTGYQLGAVRIAHRPPAAGYPACHQLAIAVDQHWVVCRDRQDIMYVDVVPQLPATTPPFFPDKTAV